MTDQVLPHLSDPAAPVEYFSTHRIPIAAFLMARGLRLDHSVIDDRQVIFFFADRERSAALQTEFLTTDSPEKTFWAKTEDLRSIVIALLPRRK